MKYARASRRILFIVRLALGCTLVLSGLPKIRQPYDFLSSVYDYELVGPRLGELAAMTLPWFELFLGICLLGELFVAGALLGCALLGLVFTVAQASALYRGLDISCGCFQASGPERVSYVTLARAAVFFAAGLGAYLGHLLLARKPESASPVRSGLASPAPESNL